MQFCPGYKVDDLDSLQKSGVDPRKVAKTLVEVFAEMIFIHGFVHGDPHPGNILVSPNGQKGFTLVLLDHGMYKELDDGFRRDYCRFWKALILRNADEIQRIGEYFGVGGYARYLPLIFTGKPINSKSALGKGMSDEEKNIVKQELKGLAMEDISSFMESLPSDFLIILRTDGVIRSILSKLGVSRSVRLVTYAKHAVYGLSVVRDSKSGSMLVALLSIIRSKLSYLQFQCILGVLGLISWLDDVRHLSSKSLRSLLATAQRLGFSHANS
uniref:ABC1 atypical kinase-like domain-containing protein n=1 Tax=Opuntia streptacantha TaxID=393608 RepID=A0A7C9APK3_OPUST